MITLSAPSHSFVQIIEPERPVGCVDVPSLCLPVKVLNDLSFQLYANVPKDDEGWFEVESEVGDQTRKDTIWGMLCIDCENDPGDFSTTAFSFTGTWRKIVEGGSGADTWVGNFTHNGNADVFSSLPEGACFNICFYRVTIDIENLTEVLGANTTLIACTNTCFEKISDVCFTSWFTYSNREDSIDFVYTDENGDANFTNQVRLPCYLRDIQFPTAEQSYTKHNGDDIKLFARIHEDYELVVDWIYKAWHKRLVVLLQHDTVRIENLNDGSVANMYITCKEKYAIDWPKHPFGMAPALTRVKRARAINILNSNCQ